MHTRSSIALAGELLTSPVKRLFRSARTKAGAPPGTLVYVGPERTEPVTVHLIEYAEDSYEERALTAETDFQEISKQKQLTWINVDGLNDLEVIQAIGTAFDLHSLVLEDLVHTGQRPKHEEYEEYVFVVLRMLTLGPDGAGVRSEQLGIVFGDGFVLSFQERAGDVFEAVRERIRIKSRRIRSRGADYLAYALIDAVVDHYFHILEAFADLVEELEVEVLENPTPETMRRIHDLRHEMLGVRRAIWPLRELTNGLVRTESDLIHESTQVFLRDVYDHTVQVIDTAETLREVVSGLMDLYMSSVSNRMNEIMKVLTIMASVFIPLTFLAGVYGMNFEFMPELGIPWAYPALLAVMVGIGLGLLLLFKRRGWL
jgi:magnesium transporter